MFVWLNKQGVQSDQGFVVQFTGRFTAEYREEGKIVTVHVEDGMSGGLPCIILDPNAFAHWDSEPLSKKIPREQQEQMFQNFKEAIEFQGLKMVVEQPI